MTSKRILAFAIDFILLIIIQQIIIFTLDTPYLSLLVWSLFLCRDGFTGQGLGKRIMRLTVRHGYATASPLKCLLRSLFYAVWFIELIVLIVNKERRIGDMVTGCSVVAGSGERFKAMNIILCIIVYALLCVLYDLFTKLSSVYSLMCAF